MNPVTRKEIFLAKISGDYLGDLPEAVTREEKYLAEIAGTDAEIPEPITRYEHYLNAIAKAGAYIPDPITRLEIYLAKAAGLDISSIPDPITREEMYWFEHISARIYELSGTPPLNFVSDGENLPDYAIFGNTVQDGTPTPENPVDVAGVGDRTENLAPPYADFIQGYIDINGKIQSSTGTPSEKTSMFIPVLPNTAYTFSFSSGEFPGADRAWRAAGCYDINYDFIIRNADQDKSPLMFTTPANTAYIRLSYRSWGSTGNTVLNGGSRIPVISGNQTRNIYLSEPLHKLGDYADETDYSAGRVIRRIRKLTLTGEEEWKTEVLPNGDERFRYDFSPKSKEYLNAVCTHYVYSREKDIRSFFIGTGNYALYFCDRTYAATEDWQSFLSAQYASGTPVTVWYILAEPEEESIKFPEIPTIKGSNTLDINTAVKPEKITIKYKK